MPYIEWRDWMAVGVPMVDADHKVLLSLINQVHDCMGSPQERADLGGVLLALAEYTDYHFRREEKLQEEVGFPGLPEHRRMHAALAGQVVEISHRFRLQPDSVRGVDVLNFLERWLIDHILTRDMAFRPYAMGKPEAEERAMGAVNIAQLRGEPHNPMTWADLSVLLVDDNANFVTLMNTILGGIGLRAIHTAGTAPAGLEILSRHAVDVVVTDLLGAGTDGFEFISAIRNSADPIIAQVAVLMISARDAGALRPRALAAGADEYMEKPVSVRDMLGAMTAAVAKRRR